MTGVRISARESARADGSPDNYLGFLAESFVFQLKEA